MHDLIQSLVTYLATFDLSSLPHTGARLIHWLEPTPAPAPTSGGDPGNQTVKVAIVTTIGIVIAAAITAVASTFKRDPNAPKATANQVDQITRQYVTSLERDRRELGRMRVSYASLREGCIEHGLDPDELIREQATP